MSIVTTCDHCKQIIRDVAYLLIAVDVERLDPHRPLGRVLHLHWECVWLHDRDDTRAEA